MVQEHILNHGSVLFKKCSKLICLLLLLSGCNSPKTAKGLYTGCSFLKQVDTDLYVIGYELHLSKHYYNFFRIDSPFQDYQGVLGNYIIYNYDHSPEEEWQDACGGSGYRSNSLIQISDLAVKKQDIEEVLNFLNQHSFSIILENRLTGDNYYDYAILPVIIIENDEH